MLIGNLWKIIGRLCSNFSPENPYTKTMLINELISEMTVIENILRETVFAPGDYGTGLEQGINSGAEYFAELIEKYTEKINIPKLTNEEIYEILQRNYKSGYSSTEIECGCFEGLINVINICRKFFNDEVDFFMEDNMLCIAWVPWAKL